MPVKSANLKNPHKFFGSIQDCLSGNARFALLNRGHLFFENYIEKVLNKDFWLFSGLNGTFDDEEDGEDEEDDPDALADPLHRYL